MRAFRKIMRGYSKNGRIMWKLLIYDLEIIIYNIFMIIIVVLTESISILVTLFPLLIGYPSLIVHIYP